MEIQEGKPPPLLFPVIAACTKSKKTTKTSTEYLKISTIFCNKISIY